MLDAIDMIHPLLQEEGYFGEFWLPDAVRLAMAIPAHRSDPRITHPRQAWRAFARRYRARRSSPPAGRIYVLASGCCVHSLPWHRQFPPDATV